MSDLPAKQGHALPERPLGKLQEGLRRIHYVQSCFRSCREVECAFAGFNESLRMLDRGLHQPRRKRRGSKRMHPEIEMVVSHFAKRIARERTGNSDTRPQQCDVDRACEEVLAKIKPRRGRPRDHVLHYYVAGLMCLWYWLTGEEVTASTMPSSAYNPQLTSLGAQEIWKLLREVDPRVTDTAVVNAIIATRGRGVLAGKEFRDWFPFYGATWNPETGAPELRMGLELACFELSYPIYSN